MKCGTTVYVTSERLLNLYFQLCCNFLVLQKVKIMIRIVDSPVTITMLDPYRLFAPIPVTLKEYSN